MYKVLSNLKCNGEHYKAGDVVELSLKEEEINLLVKDGVIETTDKESVDDENEGEETSVDGLQEMTKAKLYKLAEKEGIGTTGKENKETLVETIRAAREDDEKDESDNL